MDFDLSKIAVPFRMQPGLQRLAPETNQLTRIDRASALHAEKLQVHQAGQSRHAVPGFDPAAALAAIARAAAGQSPPLALSAHQPIELFFEEDFAVLDGASGTLPWLCVCNPSHWAPEDKLGLGFAALHAPVADNAALVAASDRLVQLVTGGDRWERFVWTVSPSARYDQHPGRHPKTPWPQTGDPKVFASQCFLRAERQTFFPVGQGTRQAVFTIRVMLVPLLQAVRSRADALRLHQALATMSEAVLHYKNLLAARAPLLCWLAAIAAD